MPTSMYKRPGSHGSLWIERSVSKRVRISVKNTGSITSMPQELLFELNSARVTPHVATFGGTAYQIATIGSVRVVRRKKYNPLAVITFLVGAGIVAAAIVKSRMTGQAEEYFSMAATGVAVMVAAFLLQLIWARIPPSYLVSKCLVEDPVVRHHGEPDHNGNKCYLRADAQNDILFDPLVGMNPAMKSLKRPQRFIREVGVNSVEGIGQHSPEGAE